MKLPTVLFRVIHAQRSISKRTRASRMAMC